jgi:hypothetical protein
MKNVTVLAFNYIQDTNISPNQSLLSGNELGIFFKFLIIKQF